METLQGLRRRIDDTRNLQSVVKTMKSVAAVSIRQYEEAVDSLGLYVDTLERGWQILLQERRRRGESIFTAAPPPAPRPWRAEGQGTLALAIGSDQGMCGPFDRRLAEFVEEELNGASASGSGLLVAGNRLRGHLSESGLPVWEDVPLPGSAEGILDSVEIALDRIETLRRERGVARVVLCHHRPREGTSFEPRLVRLLPLDLRWLARLSARPRERPGLAWAFGGTRELMASLTRQTLFVNLFRAFAASLAAENASRLAAMQAAERNLEERLDRLQQDYHRGRQTEITQELLEVVSGFEQVERGASAD